MRGKLIVLYGVNNLGKTTQTKLLVKRLSSEDYSPYYIKYPIYDLIPTGPEISAILRDPNVQKPDEAEFQKLYAQNRRDFQPELDKLLNEGKTVIAEDYIGTGLTWGMVRGLSIEQAEEINEEIRKSDLAILLDGERVLESREETHINESDDELTAKCRQIHIDLGERYDWKRVNCSENGTMRSREDIHEDIWNICLNSLK